MRKFIASLFVLILILSTTAVAFANTQVAFNEEAIAQGVVSLQRQTAGETLKLMVEKDEAKYYYTFDANNLNVPLQLGSGSYRMTLLRQSSGNKYSVLERKTIVASMTADTSVYLQSAQPVDWDAEMEAIKLAETLVAGAMDDREKIEILYDYVVGMMSYDYNKINTIDTNYVPVIDEVLATGTGICYDYSALLGAMLRSQGIPTKLVKGYRTGIDVYHAWNEVYLADEDRWAIIDSTYDNTINAPSMMFKSASDYLKVREY